jgi:alpha-galactosidase
MKNGSIPVTVVAAVISPDGRTVTLVLPAPLDAGTSYSVTMNNLTDLAGRPLGNGTQGSFQTYDKNPNGVKVFILAGQSNMVGHGKREQGVGDVAGAIGGLRYLVVNDTSTNNYQRLLVDTNDPANSAWIVRSDVKVWWRYSDPGQPRAVAKGNLSTGFAEGRNPDWFGPEYGFGWIMGEHHTNPVLLIKASWGGKSLAVDFRPPSAVAARGGAVGPYYTAMIDYTRDVLGSLGTEFPEFAGMGYEIAGFGWHQGWNDRVDTTYSAEYEANLGDLIRDLRTEFGNTNLPVSIGTTGMAPPPAYTVVELAQLAVGNPALHPEFAGTVSTVDTRPYWRDASISPSNFGYHWNHNGETHYLLGEGMGRAMQSLLGP